MFPKSKRPAPKPLSWRSLDTFCYFCSLDAFCYFLLATPRDLCYNDKEFSRFFHFRRFFGGCFHVHDAQNPSSAARSLPADGHASGSRPCRRYQPPGPPLRRRPCTPHAVPAHRRHVCPPSPQSGFFDNLRRARSVPAAFLRPALKKISFFLPLATPQTPPPHPKPGPPDPKGPRTQKAAGPSTGPAALSFSPSVRRFPLDLRIRFKQLEAALPLELAHRQQVCLARQILVEHLVPEADFVRVLARAAVVHHGDVGP